MDTLRQALLEALQGRLDARADFEDVVAVFLVGGDEYRALAIEPPDVAPGLSVPADLRYIAHPHDAPAGGGNHRVTHLLERLVAAEGLEAEAARTDIERAGGDVGVLALQRLHDLLSLQSQLGHALQVELHAQLACRVGPALRGAHAIDGLQQILQLPRVVLELAVRRIRRNQRDLHDVDQPGADAADLDLLHLGRQFRPQGMHLALDLIVLAVGIGAGVELDVGEGQPVVDGRLHLVDIIELGELVLDGLYHQLLELLGIGARIDGGDLRGGNLEVGVFLARRALEGEPAKRRETQENHNGERVAADWEFEQRHGDSLQGLRRQRAASWG